VPPRAIAGRSGAARPHLSTQAARFIACRRFR
jgi:hypothetical protein